MDSVAWASPLGRSTEDNPDESEDVGTKTKIVIGFGSLLAIIAGMGVVGYRSAVVNEQLSQEARTDARMMSNDHKMLEAFLLERVGTRDVLMGRDNESTHLFERGEAEFRNTPTS